MGNEIGSPKALKRHSFGSFLTAILCFVMIAFVACTAFAPIINYFYHSDPISTSNGLQLINSFFNKEADEFINYLGTTEAVIFGFKIDPGILSTTYSVFKIILLVLFAFCLLCCIFLLIVALKFLIAGKVREWKRGFSFAKTTFIFMVLYLGCNIALKFIFPVITDNVITAEIPFIVYLCLIGGLVCVIALYVTYLKCFKGHIFVNDDSEINNN